MNIAVRKDMLEYGVTESMAPNRADRENKTQWSDSSRCDIDINLLPVNISRDDTPCCDVLFRECFNVLGIPFGGFFFFNFPPPLSLSCMHPYKGVSCWASCCQLCSHFTRMQRIFWKYYVSLIFHFLSYLVWSSFIPYLLRKLYLEGSPIQLLL